MPRLPRIVIALNILTLVVAMLAAGVATYVAVTVPPRIDDLAWVVSANDSTTGNTNSTISDTLSRIKRAVGDLQGCGATATRFRTASVQLAPIHYDPTVCDTANLKAISDLLTRVCDAVKC